MDLKCHRFFIEQWNAKQKKWDQAWDSRWVKETSRQKALGKISECFHKMMKWPQRSSQVQVQSINERLPRSSWLTSGPPRIIQFWETLEHRYKSPSVQWARPFCNTQTFLFYLKTLQLFSLLISIKALNENQVNLINQHHSLLLGWAFHDKVGAKTPFSKMWGRKTLFQKTFNFVDTSTTLGYFNICPFSVNY